MMKKSLFGMIAAVLFTACGSSPLEVEIHNPSAAARAHETVEIAWSDLTAKNNDITPDNVIVLDAAQRQVPSQVVYEGNEMPQMLIFQASVPGSQTVIYRVETGVREEYPVQAYGRFVPERLDDYAWENNLTAYRLYGPALTNPVAPGIDVWAKSTERMVIDERYKREHYHDNLGDGMDAYKVGPTLGAGASAPLMDGQLWLSGNYETQQRLDNGPIRTTVKLTYAPFVVSNTSVALEKIISLDANSYFSKMTNVYTGGFEMMPIAAGMIMHEVKDKFTGEDYVAITEAVSDSKQPEIDGDISLGVILPKADRTTEVQDHIVAVKNTANGEPLVYWSGAGWSGAEVKDGAVWHAIVLQKREQVENPLLVTLK